MKLISNLINVVVCFIPLVFSTIAVFKNSVLFLVLSIFTLFLLVLIVPMMKGNENLWMFLLSTITLLPVNIKLLNYVFANYNFDTYSSFTRMCIYVFMFFILFQIEEIIIGIIVRKIKPHQLDFSLD